MALLQSGSRRQALLPRRLSFVYVVLCGVIAAGSPEVAEDADSLDAGRGLVSATTPMPTVKVNAVPVTLTLQVKYKDQIFFDAVRFRQTFVAGMAETLGIDEMRLYIIRLREASNRQWPQVETTTTLPGMGNEEEEDEEMAVEDRSVVEFYILDPPVGINGEKPVHWAQEKARRLAALLASESRGAWKGGLLDYIQGGQMELHEPVEVYIPEGQFDSSYNPLTTFDPMPNYAEPDTCSCSSEMFGTVRVAAGCAEHLGLAPSFSKTGAPWCMVAVECTGALEAYQGYYILCEATASSSSGSGIVRTSAARRAAGMSPAGAAWLLILATVAVAPRVLAS
eukprot:TRINITY_DN28304_c0_g1_i1.p1 TRINITY_DN28304_c0_g1~~TRINITY_DN28304_c0_g1_i1.p1  ORF type:complete len:338 (+),score=64.53 TRINITY_DN28304_c0_g1_i1:118-1131(+)